MGNKGSKHHINRDQVLGLVLAGGHSRRMKGPDKADMILGGKSLLVRTTDYMAAQVHQLIVSSNIPRPAIDGRDIPIIADSVPDRPGPLAGLLAAMDWAAGNAAGSEWVFCVSVDTPLAPADLLAQLMAACQPGDKAVVAMSCCRLHPTIGLYRLSLALGLRAYLEGGERKAITWAQSIPARTLDFGTMDPDPFFNVNTPKDFAHPAIQNLPANRNLEDD